MSGKTMKTRAAWRPARGSSAVRRRRRWNSVRVAMAAALAAGAMSGLVMPAPAVGQSVREWRTGGHGGFAGGTSTGVEVTAEGVLRLTSFAGTNVALGAEAEIEAGRALPSSRSVTDGDTGTEYDFMQDARVVGKFVKVDLGGERLINQVRILPGTGRVGEGQPEYFLKGYRIDVATAARPEQWNTVGQRPLNQSRVIDTTEDGSWLLFDDGEPVPALGRYVRITATREDPPNWVTIGEVEVYGAGYQAAGEYVSPQHDCGVPVNVGAAHWQAEQPVQTAVAVQFRTSPDGWTWPEWEQVPAYGPDDGSSGVWFPGIEPARYVQYRVRLETEDPFATPVVRTVQVGYDPRLVARSTAGRVRPRRAVVGVPVRLTYTAQIDVGAADYGVDYLVLDRWARLDTLRVNGAVIHALADTAAPDPGTEARELRIRLDPADRLTTDARAEVVLTTAFYTETSPVQLALGTAHQDAETANLQRVTPVHEDSVEVQVSGALPSVLPASSVRLVPPVVRPGSAGAAQLHFELGKVQSAVPVTVVIHDLRGRAVRCLLNETRLTAGPVTVPWDGCDSQGTPLVPGIYLYRIHVDTDTPATIVRTLGVAY